MSNKIEIVFSSTRQVSGDSDIVVYEEEYSSVIFENEQIARQLRDGDSLVSIKIVEESKPVIGVKVDLEDLPF